jgi:hypothetical protein
LTELKFNLYFGLKLKDKKGQVLTPSCLSLGRERGWGES